MSACDKCGEYVPPENDAVWFDGILMNELWTRLPADTVILEFSRHLLPTTNCPGSPSRAQYLHGQPLDTRPEYAINPAMIFRYQRAHEIMLERLSHGESEGS